MKGRMPGSENLITSPSRSAIQQRKFIKFLLPGMSVILASITLLASPQPAQADPHAVFYTAIGQRQLFLNMLAALDQADYVESATDATPGGPPNSRKDLLDLRAAQTTTIKGETGEDIKVPIFGPETNKAVNATSTTLSNLLTRSVTLEGNDLWSAYLNHQFELERARRNSTEELVRVYCQRGFGVPGCNIEENGRIDNAGTATDTAQLNYQSRRAGVRVSSSGEPSDLARRANNAKEAKEVGHPEFGPDPYDPNIANLTQQNNPALQDFLSGIKGSTANIGYDPILNPLQNVVKDKDNRYKLSEEAETVDDLIRPMKIAVAAAGGFLNRQLIASTNTAEFNEVRLSDGGALADINIEYNKDSQGNFTDGQAKISVPAGVVEQQQREIISGAFNEANDPKYVADQNPGNKPLVGARGAVAGTSSEAVGALLDTDTKVAGIQDGEVAGIEDTAAAAVSSFSALAKKLNSKVNKLFGQFDKDFAEELGPEVNPVQPFLESAKFNALQLATNGTFRQFEKDAPIRQCGYCVGIGTITSTVAEARNLACRLFGVMCPNKSSSEISS